MYYYPVLKPYVHYIPATMTELEEAVSWCHDHDDECSRIAQNARKGIQCFLKMDVASNYLWGVLKRVREFHFPPGDDDNSYGDGEQQ